MKQKHILLYSILIFGFTLGIHRGRLALWKDGSRSLWKSFPFMPHTCRKKTAGFWKTAFAPKRFRRSLPYWRIICHNCRKESALLILPEISSTIRSWMNTLLSGGVDYDRSLRF